MPTSAPVQWKLVESADKFRRELLIGADGTSIKTRVLEDTRPPVQKVVDSFLSQFFPVGYPYSVSEGYLAYTQFRVLQHFSSAILSVLSTQSLLFAAGLKPTPAQATVISWVLKDGMHHVGRLIGSGMGAQMDSQPKRWRILADFLYDFGTGLEVISPICPQYFLGVAGLANLAKGVALVAARATRLPIYSAFAKEGNLSDLYAKGEALSTLCNVMGLGIGIHLASSTCTSLQGKLLVAPVLSAIHLYSVIEQMRAAPINTLNAERTAILVIDFLKDGKIRKPSEMGYREHLLLPMLPDSDAEIVHIGSSLRKVVSGPSALKELKERFPKERFLLSIHGSSTDLILHKSATGEDVIRGWLLAGCIGKLSRENNVHRASERLDMLDEAYKHMDHLLPSLVSGLKRNGWNTHIFLDGAGSRAVW